MLNILLTFIRYTLYKSLGKQTSKTTNTYYKLAFSFASFVISSLHSTLKLILLLREVEFSLQNK